MSMSFGAFALSIAMFTIGGVCIVLFTTGCDDKTKKKVISVAMTVYVIAYVVAFLIADVIKAQYTHQDTQSAGMDSVKNRVETVADAIPLPKSEFFNYEGK